MHRAQRAALLVAALGLGAAAGPVGAETRRAFSVFAGLLADNSWEEVALTPWNADFEQPGLVGVSAAFGILAPVATPAGEITFWIEPQAVRHFQLQDHWEFNLPVVARLEPKAPLLGVIDSLAFGVGPSHATETPPLEWRRGAGEAAKNLIYWHLELTHELAGEEGRSVFLRLHHRSDGYGLVGPGESSNGVVVGLRSAF